MLGSPFLCMLIQPFRPYAWQPLPVHAHSTTFKHEQEFLHLQIVATHRSSTGTASCLLAAWYRSEGLILVIHASLQRGHKVVPELQPSRHAAMFIQQEDHLACRDLCTALMLMRFFGFLQDDQLWRLPLHKPYRKMIDSKVRGCQLRPIPASKPLKQLCVE